jgi:hypothetical protein
MKLHSSCALIALLALTACGPSRKEKAQQRLLDKCISDAGRANADPKMQVFIKDYCSCVVSKFGENLSADELDSLDQMKDQGAGAEIYKRLAPLVEPCITEQQEKIRESRQSR